MSSEEKNPADFEDKFREKFEDWDAPAPSWQSFQNFLSQEPKTPVKKSKIRFWWWSVPILLCLLGGSFIIFSQNEATNIAIQSTQTPKIEKHTQNNVQNNTLPAQTNKNVQKITEIENPRTLYPSNPQPSNTLPTQTTKDSDKNTLPTQTTKDSDKNTLPTQITKDTDKNTLPAQIAKDSAKNLQIRANNQINHSTIQPFNHSTIQALNNSTIQSLNPQPFNNSITQQINNSNIQPTKKIDSITTLPLKPSGKWWINAYMAQHHAYKIITPNKNDDILIKYFDANRGMSALNKGLEIGAGAERELTSRLKVFGNVAYQRHQLQTNYLYHQRPQGIRIDSVVNFEKVYFTPLLRDSLQRQVLQYHTLNLELGIGYGLKWKRWQVDSRFSVGYQGIYSLYFKEENQRFHAAYRPHQLTLRGGLQVGYMVQAHRQIFVEPTLACPLSPIFEGGMYTLNTYQIGLRAGVKWRW